MSPLVLRSAEGFGLVTGTFFTGTLVVVGFFVIEGTTEVPGVALTGEVVGWVGFSFDEEELLELEVLVVVGEVETAELGVEV
jgi:hypothetical protein